MSEPPLIANLASRAVIAVTGADWRSFLQGLITQDVESLAPGDLRFGALLTPQGRLLFDLFIVGTAEGCLVDCVAHRRESLIQRLLLYRLRAKVEIAASESPVRALWGSDQAPGGWMADPRLPSLGFRGYGDLDLPTGARRAEEGVYETHRLALGVPGPDDWGSDRTYPIEANFDLLAGIDFKKGCFVGQETTSRMKRRGTVKTRMTSIAFRGAAPPPGSELLAGSLRAGEVLTGGEGAAMAAVRLDRMETRPLTLADGRTWRVTMPGWMATGLQG